MLCWPAYRQDLVNDRIDDNWNNDFQYKQPVSASFFDAQSPWNSTNQSLGPEGPEPTLFPGEVVDTIDGHDCLYKYVAPKIGHEQNENSRSPRPLIVLIPGGCHNGRVFYGGHDDFDETNFLSFWLSEIGFPSLTVSYPLQQCDKFAPMRADAPGFRISDWGRQSALATKKVIQANKDLSHRDIILAAWSMGGRILGPYMNQALEGTQLRVRLFISLSATPGVGGLRPVPPGISCTSNGYATCAGLRENFVRQIDEQGVANSCDMQAEISDTQSKCISEQTTTLQSRMVSWEIIPEHVFSACYYGYAPVSLHGWQLAHSQCPETGSHNFMPDRWGAEEDAAPANFHSLPWMASISGTTAVDARHVLLDRPAWEHLNAQRLTSVWEEHAARWNRRPKCQETDGKAARSGNPIDAAWQRYKSFVESYGRRYQLHEQVHGNHYFFLGRKGAEQTAILVNQLWERSCGLQTELDTVLGF